MVICGALLLIGLGFVLGANQNMNFNNISFEDGQYLQAEMLSLNVNDLEDEFNENAQFELFLSLHNELLLKHQDLRLKHELLKESRMTIVELRKNFRDAGMKLNREDGIILWNGYHDLMDLKEEFVATKGLAYQKLIDLKGLYDIENIDLIISTYQDVLVILNQREIILDTAILLITEGQDIYQNYL